MNHFRLDTNMRLDKNLSNLPKFIEIPWEKKPNGSEEVDATKWMCGTALM